MSRVIKYLLNLRNFDVDVDDIKQLYANYFDWLTITDEVSVPEMRI